MKAIRIFIVCFFSLVAFISCERVEIFFRNDYQLVNNTNDTIYYSYRDVLAPDEFSPYYEIAPQKYSLMCAAYEKQKKDIEKVSECILELKIKVGDLEYQIGPDVANGPLHMDNYQCHSYKSYGSELDGERVRFKTDIYEFFITDEFINSLK